MVEPVMLWQCWACGETDADQRGVCRYCGAKCEQTGVSLVEPTPEPDPDPAPAPILEELAPPSSRKVDCMRDDFPTLLRCFRERAVKSRNSLAHEVGVDPSYLTRIEHGDRDAPRQHIVEALARALRLSVTERNRLLVSAGYAPMSVVQLGAWDDALQSVADVLNDVGLTAEERNEYRFFVKQISRRYLSPLGTHLQESTNGVLR